MVDLRTCENGDILVSKHGLILTYVGPLEDGHYFDHQVRYKSELGNPHYGSRTHEGYVFRNNRLPEDHDIVKIIKWKEIFKE